MNKFRTRLLFTLLGLIVVVLVGLAILIGQIFKSYYLSALDKRLENESQLIAVIVEEKGGIPFFTRADAEKLNEKLDTRISIVDLKGTIIFDSGEILHAFEKQNKQIIKKAIKSSPKDSSRIGGKYNLHYHWKPIKENNEIKGYVFLSTKLGEVDKVNFKIWWLLSTSLGLALIVILLLGVRITNRYTKPIEAATNVAIELSKGNYRARTYVDHQGATGMLSNSINILAKNLEEFVSVQEMQKDRLETLIENMGSGLILIDNRGSINLINRAFKEIFNVNPNKFINKLYYHVLEHQNIINLVEEIFMTEQKIRKPMLLSIAIERRYFEVFGSPIIGTNNEWKGVLLVFHDITEIKKLEQMRKDFVANVSHELKTPITSIKGFSETLLDGAMRDEQTLEAFLSIILKESDRLQSLIQDLLDLSKIEQQGFKLDVGKIDIMVLLEEIVTMLHQKAEQKNIQLKLIPIMSPLLIVGDYYRLKQVFINLISNALTYTPSGGNVEVLVEELGEQVIVRVKDSGIGIDKDEIPRIFERFYRVDRARSRNSGGTGLGLAIVKHIIEAHKGSISVESMKDKGTTFSICLEKKF